MTDLTTDSYLFYFTNEEFSLVKIKKRNSEHVLWLSLDIDADNVALLTLKDSMTEEVNGNPISVCQFEEGELRFDASFAKLVQFNANSHILMNQKVDEIPREHRDKIDSFLQKH